MFGVIAFILGLIAAICAWFGNVHATAFIYAAVAFIALEITFHYGPWNNRPVS
jgi:hypothetical protein